MIGVVKFVVLVGLMFSLIFPSLGRSSESYYGAPYYWHFGNGYPPVPTYGPFGSLEEAVANYKQDQFEIFFNSEDCVEKTTDVNPFLLNEYFITGLVKIVEMVDAPGKICSGASDYGMGFVIANLHGQDDVMKNIGQPCCTSVGNPVNAGTGNKYQKEVDVVINRWLRVERNYNSDSGAITGHVGKKWRHSYEYSLNRFTAARPDGTSADAVTLVRPDGRILLFRKVADAWVADQGIADTLYERKTSSGGMAGWEFFSTSTGFLEKYSSQGLLLQTIDESGFITSMEYSVDSTDKAIAPVAGLLLRVSDQTGRSLDYFYDSLGRVVKIVLPDKQFLTYVYDDDFSFLNKDTLSKVVFPDSKYRIYLYNENEEDFDNYLAAYLNGIVDENGSRYAKFLYDDLGRATLSEHANQTNRHIFAYNKDGSVEITYPSGMIARSEFSTYHGKILLSKIGVSCGPVCGQSWENRQYDENGYPVDFLDFNKFHTTYTYSVSELETQRIEGFRTPLARTTNTVWNANFRVPDQRSVVNVSSVTESLTKWAYNSRGQVLSRCEVDPTVSTATSYTCGSSTTAPLGVRQTSYTYCEQAAVTAGTCPLVGQVLTVISPRTDVSSVTTYSYYRTTDLSGCSTLGGTCHYLGDLYQVTNALGQTTTYASYDKNGRVTRMKDANGTVTDMTYSPRGWLLTRTVRANADGSASSSDAIATFGYDNVGQVTKITQPDGAYLSYTYDAAHRLTDITDNAGNAIHYTLDAAGNRTNETTKDPSGTLTRALSRQYDQLSHLTKTLNAANTAVQTSQNPAEAAPSGITYTNGYDGNGNAIYLVDGNGVGSEQQYDPLNR